MVFQDPLGIDETITSPTFTLISEYEGTYPLYHMDVYRLDSSEDFIRLGETGERIASLGEPESSIVLLSVLAGYTSKEIGVLLHLKSSTVRSKLSRALAKLREQILTEEECVG